MASPIRRVVLLHGLWMRSFSMRWHAGRLKAAGFAPELFDYPSVRVDAAEAIPMLARRLAAAPAHVVAHSLGGLLALEAIKRHAGLPVSRIVCLGSPLCGSHVATGVGERPWRHLTVGRSAGLLERGCPALPDGVEVGMVAGDRPLGLGQFLGRLDGPHDGTVAVGETRPPGLRDHVVVHASHSGLLLDAAAARQSVHFLEEGRFLHAG